MAVAAVVVSNESSAVSVCVGDQFKLYSFGADHPFGSERHDAFWGEACRRQLDSRVGIIAPVQCTEKDLARFHEPEYIEYVRKSSEDGIGYLDGGDTPSFKGVYEAASYIVGSDLLALEKMFRGEVARIFAPIAGLHHARRGSAGGFCVFNDIGVLIHTLRELYDIQRIAYVDIDAHHGDGVYYDFESDPDLIFADIHEDGRYLYPGTGFSHEVGIGKAHGRKLNLPVMPGSRDDVFRASWNQLEEFVRSFAPEIILLQAGADSITGDPLSHLEFTPVQAHGFATRRLCKIADEYCDGRIIAMGGGGYNLLNIGHTWSEVLQALVDS